jgi:hypothetical protein
LFCISVLKLNSSFADSNKNHFKGLYFQQNGRYFIGLSVPKGKNRLEGWLKW